MSETNMADQFPPLKLTNRSTYTWVGTGTTNTVTDANVRADSIIVVQYTGNPVGHIKLTVSAGSFLMTSTDNESSALTFKYVIL